MDNLDFWLKVLFGAGLVFIGIVVSFWGVFVKTYYLGKISKQLAHTSKRDFDKWIYLGDKAFALGKDKEAKVFRAKAAVVALTDCPILDEACSSAPYFCQPGIMDALPDHEIEELNEEFESMCSGKSSASR